MMAEVKNNGRDPYKILNKEEWFKIFTYLGPFDLINLYHTDSNFRDVLKNSVYQLAMIAPFVFPKVIPYKRTSMITPYKMQCESRTEALKCRLVSKHWCKAIDQFLVENEVEFCDWTKNFNTFSIDSKEKMRRLQETWGSGSECRLVALFFDGEMTERWHECPWLGPSRYREKSIREMSSFWENIPLFLSSYGRNLKRVRFRGGNLETEKEILTFCKAVWTSLQFLPRLESLFVECNPGRSLTHNREWNNFIQHNSSFHMLHLKELSFWTLRDPTIPGLHDLQETLLNSFGSQIDELWILAGSLRHDQLQSLKKLKRLALCIWEPPIPMGEVIGFSEANLTLRSLLLEFRQNSEWITKGVYYQPVWDIMQCLEGIKLLSSLENLQFVFHQGDFSAGQGAIPETLLLHSVRSIKIEMRGRVTLPLNFLLCFPNLEILQIIRIGPLDYWLHPKIPEKLDAQEIMKDCGSNLYRSNIWEKLPKLRNLHFFAHTKHARKPFGETYERELYEKGCREYSPVRNDTFDEEASQFF